MNGVMVVLRRSLGALVALSLGAAALAAPVGAEDPPPAAPDPYELALRWTLASLAPRPVAPEPAHAAPRFSPLPHGASEAGVPNPIGYGLMGLALVGAGLAARRFSAPQRGSSKKT
jgi:hypothetical protein